MIINNGAHETVGGMPKLAGKIDQTAISRAVGYPYEVCVEDLKSLDKELDRSPGRSGASHHYGPGKQGELYGVSEELLITGRDGSWSSVVMRPLPGRTADPLR